MNGMLRYFCLDHGCVVLLTNVFYMSGIFLCVSSDMLLLSVNSNCVVLFCVVSIHLPHVLYFICGSSAIGTKYPLTLSFSFYNNSFPSNAFYLLFVFVFIFALYSSFKLCLCLSRKVTKYTC